MTDGDLAGKETGQPARRNARVRIKAQGEEGASLPLSLNTVVTHTRL